MSDESKPFEATPTRVERARREGNVARASELSANLAFGAAVATTLALVPLLAALARLGLTRAAHGEAPVGATLGVMALALLPALAAALGGVAGSIAQSGGLRAISIQLKLERLDPLAGVKRVLSRETFAHAFRSALAFGIAAGFVVPALWAFARSSASGGSVAAIAAAAWTASIHVAFVGCAVGTVFATIEFAAARSAWLRRLRMSFEERKREAKEQDGDPQVRGRRRGLHRALLRGAVARVKAASFVVVNPTHVAVALAYAPPRIAVPVVVVRVADAAALRAREVAREFGVPVIENVALARALYRDVRVDEPIPHAHYVAVAEVVAALARAIEAPHA